MGYGNIGPSMAAYKQPSACGSCGGPIPFPGASCTECTAITQHAGEAGWRARTPTRRPLQPGDVLEGKWRLEELLGAGGMGQVYRARDLALERSVAIKLLHDALCEDAQSVARFEREARAMARLEHAHITPIHAVGQQAGRPFIVMKHLEGMSLARYLRSVPGPLPVPEVLALARQLCAGLEFIHGRGCVHRDIKPGNIFVSPGGHATLLDFGILWEHRGAESTGSGVRLGTPSYMAPEQARGEPVDGRADLYSLGLVLLEALTGLAPSSTCRLLGDGPEGAVRALREQAPWLPARLASVLVQATALNPEARHKSALALLTALETAERAGTAAPGPVVSVVSVVSVAAEPRASAPLPRAPEKRGLRMPVAIAGGVAVAAMLVLGVVVPWSAGESSATTAPGSLTESAVVPALAPAAFAHPAAAGSGGPPPSSTTAAAPQASGSVATPPATSAPTPATSATSAPDARRPPSASAPPKVPPSKRKPASPARAVSRSAQPRGSTRTEAPSAASAEGDSKPKAGKGRGELRVVTVHAGRTVWANVSVDGKHHGATPVSLDLPEGRYSVRVERGGFAPVERAVDVSPGTKAVVRIELHE
ncbi:serine/threonine-protein kinase [Pyxidicoccus xibeiensis]|uniref:serine/threonine-protein kinase n=1 Tax=Pyxidicoccus xibeiensis TaxID=2906759 RepID=UPI0020A75CB4|nr:protein kinase [Pyxidicoccus xibeiensis]MCP3137947.1 protein kinase [Pyxidicoccus xibeiensis]